MGGVRAIHLDIDRKDGSSIETAIRAHPNAAALQRRRSANGNLHYRITLRKAIGVEESFQLREKLGDDWCRIVADKHRASVGYDFDYVYDRKGDKQAGAWELVFQTAL